MKRADPWPWPGDSPLDRARRIARTYREALLRADAEACGEVDGRCRELGQGWVTPRPMNFGHDDLLTMEEVADLCDVQPDTVRQWRRRGLPTVDTADGLRYRVADVLAYHAQRRQIRASSTENLDMTGNS
ncbi:helix-turn-helix domain-containing protein [Amycolatopsis sp. CA-126428]|uniref:helix-turn-helix domain-containing protein n=1 Tax=Amycolatopsis sp. CA-126428 TaxID=2073158 RepID=UPI000CD0BEBE|nr:helix-turn-helix domain-containing protein [Amycolatopsis sp. CA-126428]